MEIPAAPVLAAPCTMARGGRDHGSTPFRGQQRLVPAWVGNVAAGVGRALQGVCDLMTPRRVLHNAAPWLTIGFVLSAVANAQARGSRHIAPPFSPDIAGHPQWDRIDSLRSSGWGGADAEFLHLDEDPAFAVEQEHGSGSRPTALETMFDQNVLRGLQGCMKYLGDAVETGKAGRHSHVMAHCLVAEAMEVCGQSGDSACLDVVDRTVQTLQPAVAGDEEAGQDEGAEELFNELHPKAAADPVYHKALGGLRHALRERLGESFTQMRRPCTDQDLYALVEQSDHREALRGACSQAGLQLRSVVHRLAAQAYQLQPQRLDDSALGAVENALDQRYPVDSVVPITKGQLRFVLAELAQRLNERHAAGAGSAS
ncbi:hypothetical protein [Stenotrophomonas sp. CFBP 13718]|uniref:hypothetical protein n=1 Tax=Stenotrophomonas sp. CFBP 13718 TaxID=2775304 RepID=UPI0017841C9B|nr:hypothetical protein [Stenotrophomonas sp. CFBP 13718]MBD8696987.1 hypothetical protein [Stenotrophomonas sp. CFBP 13718]